MSASQTRADSPPACEAQPADRLSKADDLEHISSRGLLLERLGQIVGALAQFVQQPRVLDGDDGLGGEVRKQFALFVGERPHFCAVDEKGADQLVLLEHRHPPRTEDLSAPRGLNRGTSCLPPPR